jgi:pentapeptide MXKDX repeat protein
MRRRPSWCIALFAAFLNVVAPVLAYAVTPVADAHANPASMHDRGIAHEGMHHEGMHHDGMRHDGMHHEGGHQHEPTTPHCPYCPDFAAGAALGTSQPVVAYAPPGHAPLPASAPARLSARPSLRLADSRGPPALA